MSTLLVALGFYKDNLKYVPINPFNAPFLYSLKTSENRKVF